jgi:predicted nucleic acid-binding protein
VSLGAGVPFSLQLAAAGDVQDEHDRSRPGIGPGDDLIAATALTEGLELATLNVRRYPMFPGLTRPF